MLSYLELMRPTQWIKNIVVLAGPAFGLRLLDTRAGMAFLCFCLAASASYVINDVMDREADKNHPTKRRRPIASGRISPGPAVIFSVFLVGASVGLGWRFLPLDAVILVAAYFLLVLAYSVMLKRRPIMDVIVIAIGFVIRAVAGAQAVGVLVSPWLVACTFTLCMFLGFGKRRCELATLTNRDDAGAHRATLLRYTPELLNHLTSVSAGIAIMTFLLYTMDTGGDARQPPFEKQYLMYTLPLVAYALFRYAMLIETGRFTGPMQIFRQDRGLIVTCAAWFIAAGCILYWTGRSPPTSPHGAAAAASQPPPSP